MGHGDLRHYKPILVEKHKGAQAEVFAKVKKSDQFQNNDLWANCIATRKIFGLFHLCMTKWGTSEF